ncbi:hypothetical protein DEEACLCL_00187 [Salmonella phage CRW-SP2]|nr:hypothetical protein DEEACLCL_00187 [Salmonella phage CRW-SP2]
MSETAELWCAIAGISTGVIIVIFCEYAGRILAKFFHGR